MAYCDDCAFHECLEARRCHRAEHNMAMAIEFAPPLDVLSGATVAVLARNLTDQELEELARDLPGDRHQLIRIEAHD